MLFGGHVWSKDAPLVEYAPPRRAPQSAFMSEADLAAATLAYWVLRQSGVPYEILRAAAIVERATSR